MNKLRLTDSKGDSGKAIEVESILLEWKERQVRGYRFPGRAGLPKGAPIPFSKSKYEASIISLFSEKAFSVDQLAKMASTTYGVFARWRTEDIFIERISENIEEYSYHFIEKYKEAYDKGDSGKIGHLQVDFFLYSIDLIEDILSIIMDKAFIPDADDFNLDALMSLIDGAINHYQAYFPSKKSRLGELIKLRLQLLSSYRKNLFKALIESSCEDKKGDEGFNETIQIISDMDERIEEAIDEANF